MLSFAFIVSGLVMGYYKPMNTVVVEQAVNRKNISVEAVTALPETIKKPEVVSLTMPQSEITAKNVDVEENYPEEDITPLDSFAIESMENARLHGDDRAPPIVRGAQGESATPEELESPELYLEYESRQERKIYKAYVEAADIKIEVLEEQIAIAQERGMAEEELEVGIEKVRRIKEMKAQLLSDNPDLFLEN